MFLQGVVGLFLYRTQSIDASKIEGKQAWQITFTLHEHLSVSEKREARANGKVSAKKQGAAASAGKNGKAGTGVQEEPEKLTWFEEKVLKAVNEMLADSE